MGWLGCRVSTQWMVVVWGGIIMGDDNNYGYTIHNQLIIALCIETIRNRNNS